MEGLSFPKDFLWGVATAAHQIEGFNYKSDWYEWEKKGKIKDGSSSEKACLSENRYLRDIDNIKNLNLNSYRFSVEWAKIETEKGKYSNKQIRRYKDMILELKKNSIEPIVTLFHFSLPSWFSEIGGFSKVENIKYFTNYVNKVVKEFKGLVQYYIIINEPMVYLTQGYLFGEWPPGENSIEKTYEVGKNLLIMYDKTYNLIKKIDPYTKISIAKHTSVYEPYNKLSLKDRLATNKVRNLFDHVFVDSILKQKILPPFGKEELLNHNSDLDFIGINYYTKRYIKYDNEKNFDIKTKSNHLTDIGREFYPEGIEKVLDRFSKYDIPIMITENGIADEEDRYRTRYLLITLEKIHESMKKGIKIIGYMHWSLMDNFEWVEGTSMRFGLYRTDYNNHLMTLRNSGEIYSKIAKENSISESFLKFIK
ncbi:glycoside hydrolase family 1 protein [Geotoga petraea]|jgi:beta-glucosidase|uniref:Glycosyl hydrolase family 1 n=1 Tax=Geotoga petraea TaxID=28234 RepID=A0A1G6N7H8_9BACT|nr:glycoside hydrolase family 1 protein [Geotoga petraea]MDK2946384.1 beta-glucosidase [Geotoga sp.]SDC63404.1 glycosyl hydrolase family 1 [Geotoga petraea]